MRQRKHTFCSSNLSRSSIILPKENHTDSEPCAGRSELRNLTLVVDAYGRNHEFSFYNALSLCPQVHLTLIVRPTDLAEAALEKKGSLRNMHGFAAVTSDALPEETDLCPHHRRQGVAAGSEATQRRDRMRRFELLLRQFGAPCAGGCGRVHKGREGTHTQATIHVSFEGAVSNLGCYYCC